jgi:hypothetical protein
MLRRLYIVMHQVGCALLHSSYWRRVSTRVSRVAWAEPEPPYEHAHFCRDQWPAASCATQCRAGRADRDDEADWSRFCRFNVRRPVSDCTVFTWPCTIYVSSHVTHVPAPGSACVSQDCAIGRSGKSLDGSRAEHLSIPIPENAEKCPSQRFFSLGNMSRGEAGY